MFRFDRCSDSRAENISRRILDFRVSLAKIDQKIGTMPSLILLRLPNRLPLWAIATLLRFGTIEIFYIHERWLICAT